MRQEGLRRRCSYCGSRRKGIPLSELAGRIGEVLEKSFRLTESEPQGVDWAFFKEGGLWERPGETIDFVVAEIAEVDQQIAEDVQAYLSDLHFDIERAQMGEEDPYGDEAHYEELGADDWDYRETWNFLGKSLRSYSRFFNRTAETSLGEIFHDLDKLRTYQGNPVIRKVEPESKERFIFRARVAESNTELKEILQSPARELGPPPFSRARSGRMNAAGISVFYGGQDEATCIAEIRPPVGSHVVVGRFEILRPVRLLDFEVLTEVFLPGSYFESTYESRKGRARFLRRLEEEISRPIMPADEEAEYLLTQAVAEFLAERIKPTLDGVIFASSLTPSKGRNVVLFHEASGVEPYDLPKDAQVSVNFGWRSEDDYDDTISVVEELPKIQEPDPKPSEGTDFDSFVQSELFLNDYEERQEEYAVHRDPTLRLDVKGIRVRRITGVEYIKESRNVWRSRREHDETSLF